MFGSLVAFTAYIWLLGVTSIAKVGTYAYVNPVVAVLLGWAVLGEPVTLRTVVAASIILLGVALVNVIRQPRLLSLHRCLARGTRAAPRPAVARAAFARHPGRCRRRA